MYENPRHCLREYIQNSYDSIRAARASGLIEGTAGLVTVSISGTASKPTLTISDDGAGIAADLAVASLVSIGASRKRSATNAGFRGIGRLAGIAYCTTLRFTTSAPGEATETLVEFDCGQMRSYMKPGAEIQDVREVIRICTQSETRPAPAEKHFMQVEMIGLIGVGLEFIEIEELIPYLRQVCPVDYSDRFSFAPRIRAFCEGFGSPLGAIDVETRFKRERKQILKGYDNAAPTGNGPSNVYDLQLISSAELGWYAWIGKSSFKGEIVDDTVAGVRFRLKNIQVGGSEIVEDLASELTAGRTEGRLQRWAVGEVFITNPSVVPNARRDGFEDNAAWRDIKKDVRLKVAKRVVALVRAASKSRSALKNILLEIANLDRQVLIGSQDAEAIGRLIALADRIIIKLNADKLSGIDPNEIGEQVAKVKGLRDTLVEAKGKIKKQEDEPAGAEEQPAEETHDDTPEPEGDADPAASIGDTDQHEEDEEREEPWSSEEMLASLIEVITSELGQTEAERLLVLARENLLAP
nr:ATP-binding protein [Rhizobium laguerreae]